MQKGNEYISLPGMVSVSVVLLSAAAFVIVHQPRETEVDAESRRRHPEPDRTPMILLKTITQFLTNKDSPCLTQAFLPPPKKKKKKKSYTFQQEWPKCGVVEAKLEGRFQDLFSPLS